MRITEMARKAQELQELKRMREELDQEIEAAQDEIKAAMGDRETVTAGAYRISWKPVTTARFDSKALKAADPDTFARFTVTTTARRFTIA